MDETSWNGTANQVVDASGNGKHGTAENSATTTDRFEIGSTSDCCPVNGYIFNGQIDDVRVYNRALSSVEIGQLYSGVVLGTETSDKSFELFSIFRLLWSWLSK